MSENKRAVVLFSGGLDSATALGCALADDYEVLTLSFDYGQRHVKEIDAVRKVAGWYQDRKYKVLDLHQKFDFAVKPWSAITSGIAVPEDGYKGGIPVTYVAGRNTIFLAFAASLAETMGATRIYTGFNALDYSGYPDCREVFREAMEQTINVGSKRWVENPCEDTMTQVICPLIKMTKADILHKAIELKVPHELTWSCYKGEALPCGKCDSCVFRNAAYKEVLGARA